MFDSGVVDDCFHLIDDGLVPSGSIIFQIVVGEASSFVHVGGAVGFGVDFVFDGAAIDAFDGAAFGIDDFGEKREAISGFVLTEVFSTIDLDFFGGSDADGGLSLAGFPETFAGFEIIGDEGGKIGFHGLVFFEREGEGAKENNNGHGDNNEEGEKVKKCPGESNHASGDDEIDKLAEVKWTEEFVVGFNVLGDFVLGHKWYYSMNFLPSELHGILALSIL